MKVLVVLHGMPPQAGSTVIGTGLRAFANGEGLRAAGHDVVYCTRIEDLPGDLKTEAEAGRVQDVRTLALGGADLPPGDPDRKRSRSVKGAAPGRERKPGSAPVGLAPVGGPVGSPGNPHAFTEAHELALVVDAVGPDVVLVEAVEEARRLPRGDFTVILDLFAPRILEQQFQPDADEREAVRVLDAIQAADHFVFSNERQRWYHMPLLALAGVDCTRDAGVVVPISCPPDFPAPAKPRDPVFIAGGVFWPWADLSTGVRDLFASLQEAGKGRLHLYGGEYGIRSDTTAYADPREHLPAEHPQLTFAGLVPIDQLWHEYAQASVAFDLMAPNPEREINLSFRQIDYLRCGLPIITSPRQVIAPHLLEYGAGWCVEPGDREGLQELVGRLLEEPALIAQAGAAAQRLARERFAWDITTRPLEALVSRPHRREHKETFVSRLSRTQGDLWEEVERAQRLRELTSAQDEDLAKKQEEIERQDSKIRQLLGTVDRLTGSLGDVSRFKNEALTYLQESEDQAIREAGELATEIERKRLDLKKKQDALDRAQKEVGKLKASLAELKLDNRALQERYVERDQQAQELADAAKAATDEQARLRAEAEALRLDLGKKDRELAALGRQRQDEQSDLQARLESALARAHSAAAERDAQAGTLGELRASLAATDADRAKKEAESDALREQLELAAEQQTAALAAKDREFSRLQERAARSDARATQELERQRDTALAQVEQAEAQAQTLVEDLRDRLLRIAEERGRLQDQLAEASSRLRDLERAVRAKEEAVAEGRRAALAQTDELEAAHRRALEDLQDAAREERAAAGAKLQGQQELRDELVRLRTRVADLRLDADKKTKALTEAGLERDRMETAALSALEQAEERARALLVSARERADSAQADRARLQARLDQALHERTTAGAQLRAATAELAELQETLTAAREREAGLRLESGDLRGDLARARNRVEELETELAARQKELLQRERAAAEARESSEAALERAAELSGARIEELREQVTTLTVARDRLRADLGQARERLRDLEGDVAKKTAALQASGVEREAIEARGLAALELAREQAGALLSRTQDRLTRLEAERGRLLAQTEQLTHEGREAAREAERLRQALTDLQGRSAKTEAKLEAEHAATETRWEQRRAAEQAAAAELLRASREQAIAARQDAERAAEDSARLHAELADAQADVGKKDAALAAVIAERARDQEAALAALERAQLRATELLEDARDRLARLAEERGRLAARLEQTEHDLRASVRELQGRDDALALTEARLTEAREQHAEALTALEAARRDAERAGKDAHVSRHESERLRAARDAAEEDLGRARARLEQQAFELEAAVAERVKKLRELERAEGQRDAVATDATDALAASAKTIEELQGQLARAEGRLAEVTFQVDALGADVAKKNAELEQAHAQLEAARSHAAQLTAELEARPGGLADRLRGLTRS